ncbi:MAG: MASE4 domain-containing protein, partial [Methanomicrobiales archaeon]|nr:MASE4 domain-containing protein [Methanomicrobiales archaeon]
MDRTDAAENRVYLANALATGKEKRIAAAIALVVLLLFAAAAFFVRIPLAQMPAFIPSYEAALFFIDLITAALLYDQAVRQRSVALVALAAGYLFDALIIVPHALTFPGAFAPAGFLGAGPQTTAWLYVFWHGGFPLFVIAYAVLRKGEARQPAPALARIWISSVLSGAFAAALAAAFAVLATRQHDLLPVVMQGGDYSLLVSKGISPAVWVLTGLAIVSLWERPQRAIDLWLILVMWIWLFDIALSAVIGSHRFDLGFYAGRVFGLVAAGFLLVTLILELTRLHANSLVDAEL